MYHEEPEEGPSQVLDPECADTGENDGRKLKAAHRSLHDYSIKNTLVQHMLSLI